MSAPPVLRDVFHGLRHHLGPEDRGVTYDNGPPPIERLDVMVYRASGPSDLTRFATIGMSIAPMPASPGPGDGGRAEVLLACRGLLSPADEGAMTTVLANLAIYPWTTGEQVNWGHTVGFPRELPSFPGCSAVVLCGPLSHDGLDYLSTAEGKVRILHAVPVTDAERARARGMPPIEFITELMAATDIYAPRLSS